jgi:hypothetical protein
MAAASDSVRVPADIDLEDRLAFGFTAKQLAILAATGITAYGAYSLVAPLTLMPVAIATAVLVTAAGFALALARRDGLAGDQLALAAARFLIEPKQHTLGAKPGRYPRAPRQPRAAALDIPVRRILRSGLIERRDGAHCQLIEGSGSSFELRSPEEKAAYAEALGRLFKSLADPLQIRVGSEPVNLDRLAEQIRSNTAGIGGLRQSGAGLARFLRELGETGDLRRLRVVVVLGSRERDAQLAQLALARRTGEAAELLRGAEVELHALDGEQAGRLLATTLDAPAPVEGSELTGVIHAQSQDIAHAAGPGGRRAGRRPSRSRRRARRTRQGQDRRALAAHPGGDRLPA